MSGFNAMWLPGTDHAGIATQMVVEREIKNSDNTTRHQIGREQFLNRVWKWKEEKGGKITEQLKVMGAALDWERERFTMDPGLSAAVRESFVKLYEEELIYRDYRLINWCPRCLTALSDLEVEYQENVPGELWSFAYPLADGPEEIVVATTRPETMLGDTAVAVHPQDKRYQHLIGKDIIHPLLKYRFPVIADEILVDTNFGTGAVKVTPAHDPNDFEVGKRHNLKFITILEKDGALNQNCGAYQGMERFEARKKVKQDLTDLGLQRGSQEHQMNIGSCQRCGTIIEPFLSKQWFVKIAPLAKPAIEAVKTGKIEFVPQVWEKTYFEWMNNIRDWCISRQLWWGHQIPAWYCQDCGHVNVSRQDLDNCQKCGSANIKQDEDVLDTWFSSALWPFSTMGWPENTKTLSKFYPTTVMETGFDIIFFWVARMIMMGIHFMKEVPFKTVFLHAMVRDHDGKKMSKVKGNVIDPLDIIYGISLDDLIQKRSHDAKSVGLSDRETNRIVKATKKEFPKGMPAAGADALRFSLISMAGHGRDIKLDVKRVEGYHFFANKIWNATKFALINLEDFQDDNTEFDPLSMDLNIADKWIITQLSKVCGQVVESLEAFQFDSASRDLYYFFWHQLCDWYIELSKPVFQGTDNQARHTSQRVLVHCLDNAIRLLHPFMPFITEEIWQALPLKRHQTLKSIMYDNFPDKNMEWEFAIESSQMTFLMEAIKSIRAIRGECQINPGQKLQTIFCPTLQEQADILRDNQVYLQNLAGLEEVTILDRIKYQRQGPVAAAVVDGADIFIPLAGIIDIDKEMVRLEKEIKNIDKEMVRIKGKLQNPNFVAKAPTHIIEKEKNRLDENIFNRDKLAENLRLLQ